MHNLNLFIILLGLLISAGSIALYPFRKKMNKLTWLSAIFLSISVGFLYWQWGGWTRENDFIKEQNRLKEVRAFLATIHSNAELAEKLKARLDDRPESARGWYLLGKLYLNQKQWDLAEEAFAKANEVAKK